MEFSDIYEIAGHFDELYRAVPYPSHAVKPSKNDFGTNKDWGAAMDEWERDNNAKREAVKEYNRKTAAITYDFKIALLKHLGVKDHPKADKLWSLAWDRGQSSGYTEVANEASELADLLTD